MIGRLPILAAVAAVLLAGCGGSTRLFEPPPHVGHSVGFSYPQLQTPVAKDTTLANSWTVGDALSTSTGTWTNNPNKFTYQWEDCNSSGNRCSDISGATSSKYTLTANDVGDTIRAVVTACNTNGCTSASSAPTGVVVTSSTQYALTVNLSGTGSGTVTSSPAGINCGGATCSANFNSRTQVTLTTAAGSGSTFAGWSGGGCAGTGTCVVTMSGAQSVTATFKTTSGLLYGSQGGPYSSENDVWPGANWQPYAASSPWNTALPSPSSATLDPNSANEISTISTWNSCNCWGPVTLSETPTSDQASKWNHPIYWAKSGDPTWTISDTDISCAQRYATSCPSSEIIPNGAQHAFGSVAQSGGCQSGSDCHMGVIQPDGTEVDAWQVQNVNPLSGGGTLTVHGYGATSINGTGCCSRSTAADQGLAAGSIRGPELAAGAIHHALSVIAVCTNGSHVPPALENAATCSTGTPANAPPDGARLQLTWTDAQIKAQSIPSYEKTLELAMEHYGVYITDTGGNSTLPMELQFEPAVQYTTFGNRSLTVAGEINGGSNVTLQENIPWSAFQVVSSCYAAGTC